MHRAGALLLLVVLVCGACAKRARPEPPLRLPEVSALQEFAIPWENAFPGDVAIDSVGRVWFTDRLIHAIGVFDPATGEFRSYPTPTPRSAPYGMVAAPDGSIWFSESGVGALARIDPASAQITEYPLEGVRGGPHLLAWRDGEIWFGLREARAFGRFDTRTGRATLYPLERHQPYSIAASADAVWISVFGALRLLEVDPGTGSVRVHELADVPVTPFGGGPEAHEPMRRWRGEVRRILAADGGVWFTDFVRTRLVRYDAAVTGMQSWESLEPEGGTYGIARSRRGLVWYANRMFVTVLEPGSGERARIALPERRSFVRNIELDERRGRAWIPLSDTGTLGMIEYR